MTYSYTIVYYIVFYVQTAAAGAYELVISNVRMPPGAGTVLFLARTEQGLGATRRMADQVEAARRDAPPARPGAASGTRFLWSDQVPFWFW